MRRSPLAIGALATGLVLAGYGLTGCSSTGTGPGGATSVQVSVSKCGAGWSKPHAGQQTFELANTDTRAAEVSLVDAQSGAVYADIEPLGPGTKTQLSVDLGSGSYAFHCAMEDEDTIAGPTVRIPGQVKGTTPAVLPVTQADLITATKSYEDYVRGQIPTLVRLTTRLQTAIAAGDLPQARIAWLPAHLEYERLGAAYDAFGDLDAEINGPPNDLPNGVHDSGWTGFHRIEYGLWHGESAASLRPHAQALLAAVDALGAQFAKAQIDPLDVSIRAHEITENALQFELTGETDFGSHSNLATVSANLQGTRTVLTIITPLLTKRYGQLATLDSELTSAQAGVDALDHDGTWTALSALTTSQREHVDADISELSELLAPVASILEPRRSS